MGDTGRCFAAGLLVPVAVLGRFLPVFADFLFSLESTRGVQILEIGCLKDFRRAAALNALLLVDALVVLCVRGFDCRLSDDT